MGGAERFGEAALNAQETRGEAENLDGRRALRRQELRPRRAAFDLRGGAGAATADGDLPRSPYGTSPDGGAAPTCG